MRISELTLLSGCDIPFEEGHLVMHVPKIKQIAFLGEAVFYSGCQFLNFTKDKLSPQDRINLKDYSDFDIIIAMLEDKSEDTRRSRKNLMSLLALLFPNLQVRIDLQKRRLVFEKDNQEQGFIDSSNLQTLQDAIKIVFNLGNSKVNTDYRPVGNMAQKIAAKMRQGRQKISKERANQDGPSKAPFTREISILAVGQHKDINQLMNYTICQLNDEYQRFMLKESYDMYVQQKMAGAKNVKAVPHWMKDLKDKQKDALTGNVRHNHRKNKGKTNK